MSSKQKVNEWIEQHEQGYVDLLQKMVRSNSTQGNETAVQKIVADHLQAINLEVDMWNLQGERLQNHPYYYSNRASFEDSVNVVGVLKGAGGGKSIILNGHVDVVPEGDHAQWTDHPYSGEVRDGYMYGRGTTDMKGGNTALMMAMDAIQSLGIRLKGDVIFQSVIEEESGGAGTLDMILQGYQADAAIIPEPTNMKIFPKQQGSKWFRLIVTGKTAHGGTRYHGVSAIDKAFIVHEYVKELEKVRNDRITDPLYDDMEIPIPINIGSIDGGDWPSSVPDSVVLSGRIGIAPEETMEEAQEEMERWIAQLGERDEWFTKYPVKVEWYGARWLPGAIDTQHPVVTSLMDNFQKHMEEDAKLIASPWGTDGGLLTQVADIPSVVFGPGITELAHHPNERIELEKVFQAANIIAATIIDWCEEA